MVNKYGATVGGQAYFVRNDFSMIDSVFQDGLIELPAAHIGTMTDIWVPFPKRVETEYDTETFEIIINESRFIIIKYMIDISTLNETDLSYFPDQSIEVNLGVKIDFTRLITVK